MTRVSFTIRSDADRAQVTDLVRAVKDGTRVEIKQARRSDPQNAKFWAMLHEVADQIDWHGAKLAAEDWKYLFLDALKREIRLVPAIDGKGFVPLGRSSSDLTVAEMADVITLIEMFGANHAVKFKDSSDANPASTSDRMNAPADLASSPQPEKSAGASYSPEASLLSDDWRDVYITTMTNPTTRAMSIMTRDTTALQMLGGEPNAAEREWMRQVATLTNRRDKGKLNGGEYDAGLEQLKNISLAEIMGEQAA